MSDFGGDDFEFGFSFRYDGQDGERQAAEGARRIAQQWERAFQNAPQVVDQLVRGARRGFDAAGDAAQEFGNRTRQAAQETNTILGDLNALTRRAQAFRDTLSAQGANPDLLAVYDQQLQKVLRLEREVQEKREAIARDDSLLAAYKFQAQSIARTLANEGDIAERFLVSIREMRRQEASQQLAEANAAYRREEDARRRSHSEMVAAEQQFTTIRNAEIRTQSNQAIQRAQATARSRIEFARFTYRQILFFERQIAAAFGGAVSILRSGLGSIQAGAARLGQVFRRSNRDLNEGLNGALLRREQSIDRSFARQNATVSSAVVTQSRLIDQLNAAQSRGIAGAVTGRSQLGAALGGGAAIGGGFLVLRQLREGFQESVNLNESLNKTRQIFGQASDDVIAFSENSVEALFVTQSAALEAAANFGIFGKAAGLSGTELTSFSKDLSVLATDLASFNNTSISDATTAISAALRGESEPIRRYGVLLNEAVLQQRAYAEGITSTVRKLEPFERVLAANAEIFAQTRDQQGDAARTANDFANSSRRAGAAVTTFFAALTRAAIPLAERITNFLFPALTNLTKFIEGDVNPALRTLRTALVGVGAALGLLLAARAAAEAIQFLGIALRFALTPLGLVIVGVAAIGAAIAVAADRSASFSEVIRGVVPAIRQLAGRGLELAVTGLNAIGRVLNATVLPALREFIRLVGPILIRGLEYVVGFFLTVLIPVLRNVANLIVNRVIPAFQRLGRFVISEVVPALRAFASGAVAVLSAVVDFLQPAIDGFRTLGGAIVDAFQTGDFTGLLGGLRAVGVGIGQVFANLGVLLYDALRPQVLRAIRFLEGAFDRIDFARIGLKILEVVRLIGFILGSIVSDPRFILALEAIAAAAIAVGANFIIGFAQGVLSNLPGVIDMLGGQIATGLRLGFRAALDNPAIFVGLIGALFAASAIRNAWIAAGKAGASGVLKGFMPALQRGVQTNRGFLIGLFGGPGAVEREAARIGARTAQSFQRSIDRTNRDINRLGGIGLIPTEQTNRGLAEVRRRLNQVRGDMTEVQAQSTLTGVRMREAFQGVAGVIGGASLALRGDFAGGLQLTQAGVARFTTAVTDQFRALRERGISAGQLLGQSLALGFSAAISGQLAGSSTGAGRAIGLAGILTSALSAGAINPALGAAVGAIGLISFAIGDSGRKAKEAAEQIDTYTQALINATDAADRAAGLARGVRDAIAASGNDVVTLLAKAGFSVSAFAQDASEGILTSFDSVVLLADGLGVTSEAVDEFKSNIRNFSPEGVLYAFNSGAGKAFRQELENNGVSAETFGKALETLIGQQGSVFAAVQRFNDVELITDDQSRRVAGMSASFTTAQSTISREIELAKRNVNGSLDEMQGAFDDVDFEPFDLSGWEEWANRFADYLRIPALTAGAFTRGFDEAGIALDEQSRLLQTSDAALAAYRAELGLVGEEAADLAPKVDLASAAIAELNRQRTDSIRRQIDDLRGRLNSAEEAATRAREAITEFFAPRRNASRLVDDLIGDLGGIGSNIEEALLQGGVRGDAAVRSEIAGLQDQIATIIQQGFDDGLRTQEEFATLLAPLRDALGEEVGESASRILSTVDFSAGITPAAGAKIADVLNRVLEGRRIEANVGAAFAAQAEVDRIQRQLDSLEASLDVETVFDPQQIANALTSAGLDASLLIGLNIEQAAAQQGLNPLQRSILEFLATPAAVAAAAETANGTVVNGDLNLTITNGFGYSTPVDTVKDLGALTSGRPLPVGVRYGVGGVAPTPGVPQ